MTTEMERRATENAELTTHGFITDLEECIQGEKARAIVYGNSAIAAVKLLFLKYGISKEDCDDVFQQHWEPMIREALQKH